MQYVRLTIRSTACRQVKRTAAKLKQAEKEAATYNSREGLFGRPLSDYSQLKKVSESFEPFQQFWATAATWKASPAWVMAKCSMRAINAFGMWPTCAACQATLQEGYCCLCCCLQLGAARSQASLLSARKCRPAEHADGWTRS